MRLKRIDEPGARFAVRVGDQLRELSDGRVTIGRDLGCEICLDDRAASRRHAVLEIGSTEVTVEDLGSLDGTRVNGARIRSGPTSATGACSRSAVDEFVLVDRARDERPTVETHKIARVALRRVRA